MVWALEHCRLVLVCRLVVSWLAAPALHPGGLHKLCDCCHRPASALNPCPLQAVMAAMRNHWEGTSHDPYYYRIPPAEVWRPITLLRTGMGHGECGRPRGDVVGCCAGTARLWLPCCSLQNCSKAYIVLQCCAPVPSRCNAVTVARPTSDDVPDALAVIMYAGGCTPAWGAHRQQAESTNRAVGCSVTGLCVLRVAGSSLLPLAGRVITSLRGPMHHPPSPTLQPCPPPSSAPLCRCTRACPATRCPLSWPQPHPRAKWMLCPCFGAPAGCRPWCSRWVHKTGGCMPAGTWKWLGPADARDAPADIT